MLIIILLAGVLYDYRAPLDNKVDPRCYKDEYVKAWVYFTDKNVTTDRYGDALRAATSQLTRAAVERRALRKGVVDHADIPVCNGYIEAVEANGGLLIKESKWLNAASFFIRRNDIDRIAKLDFVYKVTKVAAFETPAEAEITAQDTALYGLTLIQSQMFGIDRVHDLGIFGSNVRVGFLDTGLRRAHLAVRNVNVIAEHDFLSGDQILMDNDNAVTARCGVYSDMVFHKTAQRYNLFLAGDTLQYGDPVCDLMYTYSTDNGQTWLPAPLKITNYYNNWVREVDLCGNDTMYVFFRDQYGLKYMVYTDTFIVQPLTMGSGGCREPASAILGDTVYVTYHSKDDDSDTTFLMLNRGTAAGFNQETVIDTSLASIQAPEIVASNAGLGIFYHVFPQDSLYFIKSDSMPASTFSTKFSAIGKDAEAVTSGDTILLAYKDASSDPLFKVAFTMSIDFGETFTAPFYLTDELNGVGKISLAKLENAVRVAWETNGKAYFRTSYDYGVSFAATDSIDREFVYLPTVSAPQNDFIVFYALRGDSNTDGYTTTDPDYYHPRHGTEMLGLVGGYFGGRYIGAAPGAEFIVAKTESPDTNYEFPVEEDTYIAGLEWCEARGADIVSSSLGYPDWYDWPRDFDGKTSPASIAAYEATKRGVVVVTAAGNVSVPMIAIPGDAMGVITVGGIDTLYNRWEFSGYGPTFDGRRKPEIMCLSAAPIVINPDSIDSYLYSFGTSGATAMVAGMCALLLEAHPNWNADSVRAALFSTASLASAPNDSMGFGWPDVYAAVHYSPISSDTTRTSSWLDPYPNPFNLNIHTSITLPFTLHDQAYLEFRVYSASGRLVRKIEWVDIQTVGEHTFSWDGTDEDGEQVTSGIYYCVLNTRGAGNDVVKFAVVR